MASLDDVTVLVPMYNEAETVGQVVDDFQEAGFDDILVIDGDSTDGTERVAANHGARVVTQSGTGKGQTVREAVERHIDRTYVLMLDDNTTYHADDAEAMLEPLFDGSAAHVVGDRFADLREGAMTRFNQLGNSIINRGFRAVHGDQIRDVLSGYQVFALMKYIVGGEQSGDFLHFSTAPELPRTRVRQGERTDLPNLLSSKSHHQQSASQERKYLIRGQPESLEYYY